MQNALSDLKLLVGIEGYVLDMDDTKTLTSGKTVFETYIESASLESEKTMQSWGVDTTNATPEVLTAEVLLVKASIIESMGFQDAIDPQNIKVGDESRSYLKLSPEERGSKSAYFKNKAYYTIFGKYPSEAIGVL